MKPGHLPHAYHRKIRVAHLVNSLVPAGKERGIIKLLTHIDKSLFETYLYVFSGIDHFEPRVFNHLRIIDLNKRAGNDIRLPFKLAASFRRHKPDIVHTHAWGTLVEGILGAKMSGVPVVIHGEHGTFPETFLHRYFQRFFWRWTDLVLSVSAELKRKLSSALNFPAEKIRVILNGVESDDFYPSDQLRKDFRQRFGFSSDSFIVGTVGRFNPVKNYSMLIRAAAELMRKGETVEVMFVGDGEGKEELQSLAKELKIEKHVHFMGYQKEINLFLNGMDVFVLTSRSEGCSNVIQEAMFARKAVIATNVGGNPELIRHNQTGLLVESNNHLQLADSILKLKQEPEFRSQLAHNARNYAIREFSLAAMIGAYEHLYLAKYKRKFPERIISEDSRS